MTFVFIISVLFLVLTSVIINSVKNIFNFSGTDTKADYKIKPIAIVERRLQIDDLSPLIEIVRQEGIEIVNTHLV